jgi:hypothetical protein
MKTKSRLDLIDVKYQFMGNTGTEYTMGMQPRKSRMWENLYKK